MPPGDNLKSKVVLVAGWRQEILATDQFGDLARKGPMLGFVHYQQPIGRTRS